MSRHTPHYEPILVDQTTSDFNSPPTPRFPVFLTTLALALCAVAILLITKTNLANLRTLKLEANHSPRPSLPLPKRIGCIGDSITVGDMTFSDSHVPLHGTDNTHKFRGSYPKELTNTLLQAMPNSSFEVLSLAWSGRTAMKPEHLTVEGHDCGLHERTCSYWDMPGFDQLAEFNPDAVVILLGTNDSKDKELEFAPGHFENDFMAVLEQAGCGFNTSRQHQRQCFVVLPPPVFAKSLYHISETPLKQIIRPAILRAVQNITDQNRNEDKNNDDDDDFSLRKPSQRSHLHLVDVGPVFETNPERYMGWNRSFDSRVVSIKQADGVHPLAAGSRMIGWCVYNHMAHVYGELPALTEIVVGSTMLNQDNNVTDFQHTQDLIDARLVDEYC